MQDHGSGKESAVVQPNQAPGRAGVDGRLDGLGVHGDPVPHGAEISHIVGRAWGIGARGDRPIRKEVCQHCQNEAQAQALARRGGFW